MLICILVLAACKPASDFSLTPTPTLLPTPTNEPAASPAPPTLRQLADQRKWMVGTAIDPAYLTNPQYTALLEAEFNGLVAENVMKWGRLSAQRGSYDFSRADALMEYAARHQMAVRGHTLVWDIRQLPQRTHYDSGGSLRWTDRCLGCRQ